jgi:ubiquinone/menaquinone biosynthesis C-methylase UbiE
MDERLQRRVQRYGWDKSAAQYEGYWHQQLAPALVRLRELANCQPGERVLDVACGTGLVSFSVAEDVGPNGSVFGVDLSERMIEIVRAGAAERGLLHTRFDRMDAEDLRVDDASYDVALCSLGLMYVPNPRQALQEMHRALAPGARTVVSVWGQRDRCGWAEIFPIVDARVASEVCPMFYRLGGAESLAWEMEAAGFTDVTTERIETRLMYVSPEDACGAAFDGGPVALAYSRFDEQVKSEVRAEYLASIDAFRDGDGYAVPGEFVIGVGRKH